MKNKLPILTDGLTGVATVARIFDLTGKVFKTSVTTGLVAIVDADETAGIYDTTAIERTARGVYIFTVPAGLPAGTYRYEGWQGTSIVFEADFTWDGTNVTGNQEILAALAAIALQTALIAATPASYPATTGAVFDPTGAETALYWSQGFVGTGLVIDGWTKAVFTLKRNPSIEDDSDSLLTVRVSNPAAAGTDGILTHNLRPVDSSAALRGKGILSVESTTPDTVIRVTLFPDALSLPASLDNAPYTFEIDYWDSAGIKKQMGRGEFTLARSVRRGITAP